MCRSASHRGVIQRGCTPEKISPATIDLWLSRPTSRPPSAPPATAIIAALTDSELPQVEKNAVLGVDGLGHQLLGALQVLAAGATIVEPAAGEQVVVERLASRARRARGRRCRGPAGVLAG